MRPLCSWLRPAVLLLLALAALLGDAGMHGLSHGGGGTYLGSGQPEIHRGDCEHLPAMHADGGHQCLLCHSGPTWLLTTPSVGSGDIVASSSNLARASWRTPHRSPDGPALGPRGPPTIG